MNTHKKSPTLPTPGQAPQEGTKMERQNNTSNFTPAQTPMAMEIQGIALWVSEHIGTNMDSTDMILVRDNLLALADRMEALESASHVHTLTNIQELHITLEGKPDFSAMFQGAV